VSNLKRALLSSTIRFEAPALVGSKKLGMYMALLVERQIMRSNSSYPKKKS